MQKNDVQQLNGSQVKMEHQKSTDTQKWTKDNTKKFLSGEWQVWQQFHGLNEQNNILQRSLQSFKTNYYITLWNTGVFKQTDKQILWLNSITEIENTEFTLVTEEVQTSKIYPKTIPLVRNETSKIHTPSNNQ